MAANLLQPSPHVPLNSIADNCNQQKLKDISVVGSLKFCKNMQDVKLIHGQMVKKGLTQLPPAVTKLIAACVEMGSFESLSYARKAFELILEEGETNLFMWNSLIRGYSSLGLGEEAMALYLQMVEEGITPDKFTFPFVLSACSKITAYEEGLQVHGFLIKIGLDIDVFVQNSLIHFYSECGEMVSARTLFDGMPDRNVVSWTSLICGYTHKDHPEEAVALFDRMREDNKVAPNSVTMACVISACSKLRDIDLGESIFSYIGERGIRLSSVLANSLVDMYMKCGAAERAKQVFDESREKNLVSWNTLMSNYARQGMAREVLEVFDEMLRCSMVPDRVSILAVISACAQLGKLVVGRQCHGYVIRNGLDGWDAVTNSVIDMYMKCGGAETALSVFNMMLKKSVVSWNTVIAGSIRNGDLDSAWRFFNLMPEKDRVSWNTIVGALVQESWFEEAIGFFREMQHSGIDPDRVTMVSMASACGYLGALELGKWVHAFVDKKKIPCDVRLGTALVDMYARCGDPRRSIQMFHRMKEKDVSAWTAAIGAMAMEGNGRGAIKLFNEMIKQKVEPDEVAFVGVLSACSHSGLVEEGQQFFHVMSSEYGVAPQIVHYGCMVDLLGRAGLLEEAKALIESMPVEPNDVVWGALLAACRIHKNAEMANYAAERVLELAPERTGIQVLLSNVFASAGRWKEVARVRLYLKDKGVQKLPGSSSIDVHGSIYEFTSGDDFHPQITLIARMLDEIGERLSSQGHVPDLANVLLDIDEKEKEQLLSRHSEKLAMAFGLISTSSGSPIRVIKNLRMCSDCHSFAKLVSEIYSREIVIRDNNRFHFFRQGKCSCMDYW